MSETPPEESAEETPAEELGDWWDDPSLPWRHKPTRADVLCFSWLGVAAVYGVVISVLRPGLLGSMPQLLASFGSWSGAVMVGALARTGDPWWPLVWVLGSFGLMKFDWVYWWAGKLWGRGMIDIWSARSERSARWVKRAEVLARKYETLAIIITFLPLPIPRPIIQVALGEAGTSLKKLLTVSLISAATMNAVYLGVGYWIGEPAVAVMQQYGNYLWYVSLAVLVVVLYQAWAKQKKSPENSDEERVG